MYTYSYIYIYVTFAYINKQKELVPQSTHATGKT